MSKTQPTPAAPHYSDTALARSLGCSLDELHAAIERAVARGTIRFTAMQVRYVSQKPWLHYHLAARDVAAVAWELDSTVARGLRERMVHAVSEAMSLRPATSRCSHPRPSGNT